VIVVDASVLIAHLDQRDAQHEHAEELLLDLAERPLGASPITLAEVLVEPARKGHLEAAEAALHALAVRELPMGENGPPRLARLRAETGLKLPDCCVVLAAQDGDAAAILTFDEPLQRVATELGFA
jgi:predicted nucleic acid-binding protein